MIVRLACMLVSEINLKGGVEHYVVKVADKNVLENFHDLLLGTYIIVSFLEEISLGLASRRSVSLL